MTLQIEERILYCGTYDEYFYIIIYFIIVMIINYFLK